MFFQILTIIYTFLSLYGAIYSWYDYYDPNANQDSIYYACYFSFSFILGLTTVFA